MKTVSICLLALGALAPFAHGAENPSEAAANASDLSPVTVQAASVPPVRFDVREACPAIDAELRRTVSSAWNRVYRAGTMQVQFRVENQHVTELHSSGSLQDYRPYVRRALSRVTCGVASAGVQDYRFLLVVRSPDEASGSDQFALLSAQ